ncbi:hypothetical protein E2C01_024620 [Portunus trituberculatus]|uniref:Uncharacterized protein n=1 Tax=Portunus trituberculatus TaxID=210409 RepID=A0A5B7ED87_PORTR|nr:hypothetical protein [Portunus trituberculatus]
MLEGATRGRGGGCLSGSGVLILPLNTWTSKSAFSWLMTVRFPHDLVRTGTQSREVTLASPSPSSTTALGPAGWKTTSSYCCPPILLWPIS